MTVVVLATLWTRHFEFAVVAPSKEWAMTSMRAAWNVHRQQTGATGEWADVAGDVAYREMTVGVTYRDDAPLVAPEVRR